MAAANLRNRGIATFGKRAVTQIWSAEPTPLSASALAFRSRSRSRRGAHASAYEKNPEEQVRPTVVPDEVIEPQSDKYWAPHPKTGIFGPASTKGGGDDTHPSSKILNANADDPNSVLEHKAWFRPTSLEDLEKPAHH